MRVLLHDFSGHPFQAELARALAARHCEVLHVQCRSYRTGKGRVSDAPNSNPRYFAIDIPGGFNQYSMHKRLFQEIHYGTDFVRVARDFDPHIIISCNDPLVAKAVFGVWARVANRPWVFWLQDLYSVAMAAELQNRGATGRLAGRVFKRTEAWLLRQADAVVPITQDFDEVLDGWKVPSASRTVIENWAPLAELPERPRANSWRAGLTLQRDLTFLYTGTLGLKHNPELLYRLAESSPQTDVVVVSEGLGAKRLATMQEDLHLPNLHLLPFQPYHDYPNVLASADVLVVLLEESAARFSVPSKVLSYLCAGRPILGSVPAENLAAETIRRARAGIVVSPSDLIAFLNAAATLRDDETLRSQMGAAARRYAERTFDISMIVQAFGDVLSQVADRRGIREGTIR